MSIDSIKVTGFEDAIYIPKTKENKSAKIPEIEYTTEFDQTLSLDKSTTIVHSYGGVFSRFVDSGIEFSSLKDLIEHYRTIEFYPDLAKAIQHIIMEIFPVDIHDKYVDITFKEDSTIPEKIKTTVHKEFDRLYDIVDNAIGLESLFHSWYVDGRMALYKVIDTKKQKDGIINVQQLDPTNLFPVTLVEDVRVGRINKTKVNSSFFVYKPDNGFSQSIGRAGRIYSSQIQLDRELVTFVASGLRDSSVGYLHPCVKPVNALMMLEDAAVVYRIAHAPERRVFYVDVGSLPTKAADAYLKQVIRENAVQMKYDASTGTVQSRKKNVMSMLENIYLPRREGGKGTEVTTLPGGANLDQIADLEYAKRNVRQATNVPLSRFDDASSMSGLGFAARSMELSKDEMVFSKFVRRLKKQFFSLFFDLLKTQLVLKNVAKSSEVDNILSDIILVYPTSNMIEREIQLNNIEQQVQIMTQLDGYVGKWWTPNEVHKQIFGRTDEDILKFNEDLATSAATTVGTSADMEDPNFMTDDGSIPNIDTSKLDIDEKEV